MFNRVAIGTIRRMLVRLHGISTIGVLTRTGTTPSDHVFTTLHSVKEIMET